MLVHPVCPTTRVCCTNSRAFPTRKTLNYCTVQMSIVVLYIAAHFWQFTRHRNPTKHYKNVNSHLVKADFPQRPMQTMRLRTSHITFLMQCTKALQHIHSVSINILPFMPTVRNNTPMFFLIQCIIEKNRGLGGTDLLEKSAPMTFWHLSPMAHAPLFLIQRDTTTDGLPFFTGESFFYPSTKIVQCIQHSFSEGKGRGFFA